MHQNKKKECLEYQKLYKFKEEKSMEITELTVHELKEKLNKKELTVTEITKA